jgi:hypothetical protein
MYVPLVLAPHRLTSHLAFARADQYAAVSLSTLSLTGLPA